MLRIWPFSALRDAQEALRAALNDLRQMENSLEVAENGLEAERGRRISAEALAAERASEIDRLYADLKETREALERVRAEKFASLEAVNLELLKTRAAEPTPELPKKDPVLKAKQQIVSRARQFHHDLDAAILMKLHPAFAPDITVPGQVPVVEGADT